MPHRISRASRTPAVVIRPVRAPLPVRMALVVTVVPWTMVSMEGANSPSASGFSTAAAMPASPSITPSDGSPGVDRTLKTSGSAPSRVSRKSVKVPPTSMPMRTAMPGVVHCRQGCSSPPADSYPQRHYYTKGFDGVSVPGRRAPRALR